MLGRKRVKGLLLVGHEKVPHGFGLTRDRSGDTADSAGTEGMPEPWTCTSLLRYGAPDWAKGRWKDCAFMGILKDFSIFNEDIKSLL